MGQSLPYFSTSAATIILYIIHFLLQVMNSRDFSNMEAMESVWFVGSVHAHLIKEFQFQELHLDAFKTV